MNAQNRILLISVAAVGLMICAARDARADDAAQVRSLRVDKLPLYDRPNGTKAAEITRDKFKGPWPIVGKSPEGFLQVDVEGNRYWIRPYAVETDQPVRTSVDCGGVIASREPKSGATRGVGEECRRK
jgi:hypothetical protein